MIESKQDLKLYLSVDKKANKICNWKQAFFSPTLKFLRILRKLEYHSNLHHKVRSLLYKFRMASISLKTGITIPPNTFGKGLYLPHYGCIIVNGTARFGDYCQLQCGVNISGGAKGGDHIYFGTGAKIMENVYIPNDVIVGANAVLTKSINEQNTVWAGVPAKKISDKGFATKRDHF